MVRAQAAAARRPAGSPEEAHRGQAQAARPFDGSTVVMLLPVLTIRSPSPDSKTLAGIDLGGGILLHQVDNEEGRTSSQVLVASSLPDALGRNFLERG
jgi:hypothetical protein